MLHEITVPPGPPNLGEIMSKNAPNGSTRRLFCVVGGAHIASLIWFKRYIPEFLKGLGIQGFRFRDSGVQGLEFLSNRIINCLGTLHPPA